MLGNGWGRLCVRRRRRRGLGRLGAKGECSVGGSTKGKRKGSFGSRTVIGRSISRGGEGRGRAMFGGRRAIVWASRRRRVVSPSAYSR